MAAHYVLAAIAAALSVVVSAAHADPFTLTSKTFTDGEAMPNKVSDNRSGGACHGENVSPQLSWTNPPAGAKTFVLAIVDPQGRNGLGVYHFVGYGIPASVTSFAEAELSSPSDKYVGGTNTPGLTHYSGPCPPPGPPHHYSFVLIATDLERDELPPELTLPAVLARLEGHAKGSTGMVGLFGGQ
jgi:Raf kinase inhibitor-like YbhB/YbcL family protein